MPVGFVVDIVVSLDKHVLLHALLKNDDIKILHKSISLLYNEILVPVFSENIENYSRTIEYCISWKKVHLHLLECRTGTASIMIDCMHTINVKDK